MHRTDKATFTLIEAAALLSCHRETLRRAIRDGALRAARLGRAYRISRLDLEAFWTACGGGDLFLREEAVSEPAEEKAPPAPAGKEKKGRGEVQLRLFADSAAAGAGDEE
ncbi:MAG: excisionase family DNA-binding protein [Desulfovibrio sp.]|jgi:excisionase family DNA binding protein|nr:excisionase family DNA-binding protein [Desulfovibrio sp.]